MLPVIACHNDKGKVNAVNSNNVQARVVTTKKDTTFKPYSLVDNYMVTDTGYYNEELGWRFRRYQTKWPIN